VGTADGCATGLGQAEVPDLSLPDEIVHGAGDVLDGHVGIDAMLVQEVDRIDLESLERCLRDLADVLRPAVHRSRAIGTRGC